MDKKSLAEFKKKFPKKNYFEGGTFTRDRAHIKHWIVDYETMTEKYTFRVNVEIEQDKRFLFQYYIEPK